MSLQLAARTVLAKAKSVSPSAIGMVAPMSKQSSRNYASEADPTDYGHYPDPLQHAQGGQRETYLARLRGSDRYEPKIFYRAENSTRAEPNLVPSTEPVRLVGCLCEPDSGYLKFWAVRKGGPRRCECGHWFQCVDQEGGGY
uniref:Cytochrome c oxidase subunit Vb n=1 Tax=Ditylenchus dipsaci TaxID=166011 RepID=A0A915CSI8_9BILA